MMADRQTPADVVKGLHAKLREEVRSGHRFEYVWSKLLSDTAALSAYSTAMSSLATGCWEEEGGQAASRISWCLDVCKEYCQPQGALNKLLLKDLRRKAHNMPTLVPLALLPDSVEQVAEEVHKWSSAKALKLLDVGSCYNPFRSHPQFAVTAIDIAPANETVLECDFLSVAIEEQPEIVSPPIPSSTLSPTARKSQHTISVLHTASFDVVVFSLLLSFLPAPRHRLEFCCKAHRLLVLHGLLLVITPDSSHQNKHAAMMKHWKTAIEAIGFHRWKYYKDMHLHCMAFRKTIASRQSYHSLLENENYHLYIPQDKSRPQPSPVDSHQSVPPVDDNLLSQMPFYDQ